VDVTVDDGVTAVDVHRLQEITAAAAEILTEAPRRRAAVTYLRQRGIDAAALTPEWVLGYAPPGWTRMVDQLVRHFPEQALLDAGIAQRSSRGNLIDTFRDRVTFGIRDRDGTISGFIGRDLSGNPDAPKYLNTRRHALFDKGALLFGMYEGTLDHSAYQPVVVEGPLDVLAIAARQRSDQDPRLLPIASCGTAFTITHARRVAQRAACQQRVVVAMDADSPGRAAALTAGERLRYTGLDVRVAALPNGTDPAEYLAGPGSTLDTFLADCGLPLVTIHLQDALAKQGDSAQWIEGRLAALRCTADYLSTYPTDYVARQTGWLARALDLEPTTVTNELAIACIAANARSHVIGI
jgi:DNA primase